MKTLIFGDSYIEQLQELSAYFKMPCELFGRKALPVTDIVLRESLNHACRENDLVIWSCANWYNGISEYPKLLKRWQLKDEEFEDKAFMLFQTTESRLGFDLLIENKTSLEQRNFMRKAYVEIISYFLNKFSNLYLCPLALYLSEELLVKPYFSQEIGFWQSFHQKFKNRIVSTGPFNVSHILDEKSNLTLEGLLLLKDNLAAFIEHKNQLTANGA